MDRKTAYTGLYCGPDLYDAMRLSQLTSLPKTSAGSASRGLRLAHFSQFRDWRLASRIYSAIPAGCNDPILLNTIGFVRNANYFAQSIFGHDDFKVLDGERSQGAHIRVCDFALPMLPRSSLVECHVPTWISQNLVLNDSWPGFLDSLQRKHRKELRRLLRVMCPNIRITRGRSQLLDFYDRLYRDYVRARFDDRAVLPSRSSFIAQYANSWLLEITTDQGQTGANLLDIGTRSMAIQKTGLSKGARQLSGFSDLLDYFSIMLAFLCEIRSVQFGSSRANLNDGVLQYKAKWGASLVKPARLKRAARIQFLEDCAATRSVLRRNRFIQSSPAGFFVKALADPAGGEHGYTEKERRLASQLALQASSTQSPAPELAELADLYSKSPCLQPG